MHCGRNISPGGGRRAYLNFRPCGLGGGLFQLERAGLIYNFLSDKDRTYTMSMEFEMLCSLKNIYELLRYINTAVCNYRLLTMTTFFEIKPHLREQFFLDKFTLTRKKCSCRWRIVGKFSLSRKIWHASFSLTRKNCQV